MLLVQPKYFKGDGPGLEESRRWLKIVFFVIHDDARGITPALHNQERTIGFDGPGCLKAPCVHRGKAKRDT